MAKTLPDRSFSIRRDFPDNWYKIANGSGDTVDLTIPVTRWSFPPGLTDVRVSELALSARTTSGVPCAFVATLTITSPGGSLRVGATVQSIGGIASSRQTGGAGWHSRHVEGQTIDVTDNLPPLGDGPTQWAFVQIVSLCHGPKVLISSAQSDPDGPVVFPRGTEITGLESIHVDLENAGFVVLRDQATVYDAARRLLTARGPNDLGPLCEAMGRLLSQSANA